MNKNKNSEQEINDFLSKVEIPLGKSKEDIWAEKFEKVILSKDSQQSKKQRLLLKSEVYFNTNGPMQLLLL